MPQWCKELVQAWETRRGPVVFATSDENGVPNVIYITWVKRYKNALMLADNYFKKTRANILHGSRGALVFLTKEGHSYQVKGPLEYHTSGPVYDELKNWLDQKFPGHAAALLEVEEVYSNYYGSKRIQ